MDPLSDVLSLLKPRSTISAGLDAGGDWAIAFGTPDGIKFNAIVRGSCWLAVEGDEGGPYRLEEGDCFLLTQARPFRLASCLSLPAIEADTIYNCVSDATATCNGGGDFFLIGGRFSFSGDHATVLFGSLPPVIHIRQASIEASVLRWSLDRLTAEVRGPQPGGKLVAGHLAHIMLVQVLRPYLDGEHQPAVGWFHALTDPKIGKALGAIHADPARQWSLGVLASIAGMSRTAFAERFRFRVGESPMHYLTRWRMLIVGDRLRATQDKLAVIAAALGYESESAFSTAFKRTMRVSPRAWRDRGDAGSLQR